VAPSPIAITGDEAHTPARQQFKGVLVANMGYSAAEANEAIAAGAIDAVAFGTSFLANPDVPERSRRGAALNPPDPATFYRPWAGRLHRLPHARS
jgi:N-ethylmaleimide reductase